MFFLEGKVFIKKMFTHFMISLVGTLLNDEEVAPSLKEMFLPLML